ncbi:hypothetical protein [Methyloversatilis sp.]|uniref:hypothetical protein n=1 Tax=Methyloversatilis sp. TaxID=2569862 RepID=UPI0035B37C08
MSETRTSGFVIDLGNHSNRLRLESAVPGRPMKVVVRDPAQPDGPPMHGTGVLSADGRRLSLDIATVAGPHHQECDWATLRAALDAESEFD